MQKITRKLAVSRETIRVLGQVELRQAVGAELGAINTFQAATRGMTDCQSEAGGCPSGGFSCINYGCCGSSG